MNMYKVDHKTETWPGAVQKPMSNLAMGPRLIRLNMQQAIFGTDFLYGVAMVTITELQQCILRAVCRISKKGFPLAIIYAIQVIFWKDRVNKLCSGCDRQ